MKMKRLIVPFYFIFVCLFALVCTDKGFYKVPFESALREMKYLNGVLIVRTEPCYKIVALVSMAALKLNG